MILKFPIFQKMNLERRFYNLDFLMSIWAFAYKAPDCLAKLDFFMVKSNKYSEIFFWAVG